MVIGVEKAASILGVSPQRVRAMIAAGNIPAERVGRAWVISEAEIARPRRRSAGRPMSARMANAFLRVAADEQPAVAGSELTRLLRRLRQLADESHSPDGDPADLLRAWMSERANRLALSVHPSDVGEILRDDRIQLSGVSHALAAMSGAPIAEG